jgi:2-amino-4-hydroxy-6-hydroxymethyldihydropteridine diphosphokinase
MTQVYVSIGSNVDRERHVRAALAALEKEFGALRVSPIYETEAVGFKGAAFYNLVAGFDTDCSVAALSAWLRALEDAHGRVRGDAKFSDRTLDVDLLVYGDASGMVDGVQLPRDETTRYAFVLKPLVDIDPALILPGESADCQTLWQQHPDVHVRMPVVALD